MGEEEFDDRSVLQLHGESEGWNAVDAGGLRD
jgi:hypothetical protein